MARGEDSWRPPVLESTQRCRESVRPFAVSRLSAQRARTRAQNLFKGVGAEAQAAPGNCRCCRGAAQALAEEATPLLMPLMDIIVQGALTSLEFGPITVWPPTGPPPSPALPASPPITAAGQPTNRSLLDYRVQFCSWFRHRTCPRS